MTAPSPAAVAAASDTCVKTCKKDLTLAVYCESVYF